MSKVVLLRGSSKLTCLPYPLPLKPVAHHSSAILGKSANTSAPVHEIRILPAGFHADMMMRRESGSRCSVEITCAVFNAIRIVLPNLLELVDALARVVAVHVDVLRAKVAPLPRRQHGIGQ